MPTTPNHGYNVPNEGETDWHEPLNENFEQYDTDIEIRDEDANKGNYEPKAGAKFLATDTGKVYTGDGANWNHLRSTGNQPILSQLNPNNEFLGIGRDAPLDASEFFGVEAPVGSSSLGGMYVNTDSGGIPFYGYAIDGVSPVIHSYDPSSGQWTLTNRAMDLIVDGDFVLVGTPFQSNQITEFERFGIRAETSADEFGGMYVGTSHVEGLPFYGYASDGTARVWHYYHPPSEEWRLADSAEVMLRVRRIGNVEISSGLDVGANLNVDGNLNVAGNKNFSQTVTMEDGEKEVVYTATEAGTPRTEASGVAKLEDGRAIIDLPEHFGWVTSDDEPLVVQTTPYGGTAGLKVVERSTGRLVVEDLDGEGDYEFAYTVKGTREGHADKQVVREPTADRIEHSSPTAPADD